MFSRLRKSKATTPEGDLARSNLPTGTTAEITQDNSRAANSDHAPLLETPSTPTPQIHPAKPAAIRERDLPVASNVLKDRSYRAVSILKSLTLQTGKCQWAETGDRNSLCAYAPSRIGLWKVGKLLARLGLEFETDISMNKIRTLKVPLNQHNLNALGIRTTVPLLPKDAPATSLDQEVATQHNAATNFTPSAQVTSVQREATVGQETLAASIS